MGYIVWMYMYPIPYEVFGCLLVEQIIFGTRLKTWMIGALGELSPYVLKFLNFYCKHLFSKKIVRAIYMYIARNEVFGCLLVEKIFFEQG